MKQNLNRSDLFSYWRGMMAELFGRYPFVSFMVTDRYRITAFGWFPPGTPEPHVNDNARRA